ncbi:MAG: AraC family transcriptional regulator [Bryobacteraceae bacterium]
MQYREFKPSPPLADCVKCFWILEAEAGLPVQTIYPDGCTEIIFQYGDHFLRQPRSVFAGQIYEHLKIAPSGRMGILGVRFHPTGAAQFFRQPQSEFTAQLYSLDEIWGAAASTLEQQILDAPGAAARVAIVEAALIARKSNREAPPPLAAALSHLGQLPIREICARLAVSPRQLERLFQREIGLNPKLYARIRRFQQALQLRNAIWSDVVYQCGYYDQAHLIHEFVEFTGQPPSACADPGSEMSVAFLQV